MKGRAHSWLVGWRLAPCLGWILALLAAGPGAAAVSSSMGERLRAAIRLPEVQLQAQFGASHVQDWHGDDDVPDPRWEAEQLRQTLTGQPADAPKLLRIAEVVSLTKDRSAREAAGKAALESARRWVSATSGDARSTVQLALATQFEGDAAQAVKLLEPLTGSDSRDPGALHALAVACLGLGNSAWMADTNRGISALGGGKPPTEAQDREARRQYDRALGAIGRAIELKADEARYFTLRARVHAMRSLLDLCQKPAVEPERRVSAMMVAAYPGAALPDLVQALKLRPDDPRLVAAVVFHECSSAFGSVYFNSAGVPEGGAVMRKLPEATQERVRAGMAKLERLGEGADRLVAAAALENLGILRVFVSMDMEGMGRLGLRAFRLDPRRGQAFDMATSSQVSRPNPDWAMLEELVRERMKVLQDERLRLLLAKVQDRRGNVAAALDTIGEARRAHADSTVLRVAEFALRLKRGDFSGKEQPGETLEAIGRGLEAMREGPERASLHQRLFITLVIANALEGEVGVARQRLRQFLAQVPDDDYALEVDRILREIPASE
jgi:tetratricopeptide (TPR) repeat protein